MRKYSFVAGIVGGLVAALAIAISGGHSPASATSKGARGAEAPLPQGSEPSHLDADEFTLDIDNSYWPMRPGSHGSTRRPTPRARGRKSSSP